MKRIAVICENFTVFKRIIIEDIEDTTKLAFDYNTLDYIDHRYYKKETNTMYYLINKVEQASKFMWDNFYYIYEVGDNLENLDRVFSKVLTYLKECTSPEQEPTEVTVKNTITRECSYSPEEAGINIVGDSGELYIKARPDKKSFCIKTIIPNKKPHIMWVDKEHLKYAFRYLVNQLIE